MFAICYACDDNYVPQVGVSIKSFLLSNQDLETDIFIFADGIDNKNKEYLYRLVAGNSIKLTFIETNNIIKRIKNTGLESNVDNSSLSTFVRLFIQDYIPESYERVIYIDADTLIVGSIKDLLDYELNNPIAAVIDIMPQYYKNIIGFNNSYYFNCGILLINMNLWREKKCEYRIFHHITSVYNKYLYADQDVINIVLKNEIDILPLRYNSFPFYGEIKYENLVRYLGPNNNYYSEEEYLLTQKNPAIIHLVYSVVDRPWFKGNLNKYGKQWDEVLSQTDWKLYKKKKRKIYSRTKVLQLLYKLLGEKLVIDLQRIRNRRIFNSAKKQYEEDWVKV